MPRLMRVGVMRVMRGMGVMGLCALGASTMACGGGNGEPIDLGGDATGDGLQIDVGGDPDADLHTDGSRDGPESDACASTSAKSELAPLDLVLLIDKSASMDFDKKWASVKTGLTSFVTSSSATGIGAGLQLMPIRAQCNVDQYAALASPIAPLPGAGADITAVLAAQKPSGGTPMVPALDGVIRTAEDWASKNPKHIVVVILATDGVPDDTCTGAGGTAPANTLDNAVALVTDAKSKTVRTFVIGVGTELAALSEIAIAGGTTSAILLDTTKPDLDKTFLAALDAIRKSALPCSFDIPPPTVGTIDYDKVNVELTSGAGSITDFGYVGDATGCSKAPAIGWYYDDPASPKKVILCADACDNARAGTGAQISVLFGCKRHDVIR